MEWHTYLKSLKDPVHIELAQLYRKYGDTVPHPEKDGISSNCNLPLTFVINFNPTDPDIQSRKDNCTLVLRITLPINYPKDNNVALIQLDKYPEFIKDPKVLEKALRIAAASLADSETPMVRQVLRWLDNNLAPYIVTHTQSKWTISQQAQLDSALRQYSCIQNATERWQCIERQVSNKSIVECVERFKYLCSIVSEKQVVDDKEKNEELSKEPVLLLQPERKFGTQVALIGLELHGIDSLRAVHLGTSFVCTQCPQEFNLRLSTTSDDERSSNQWCTRCAANQSVSVTPVLVHVSNNIMVQISTSHCRIRDVSPVDFIARCSECSNENLVTGCFVGSRKELTCYTCHARGTLEFKEITCGTNSSTTSNTSTNIRKKTRRKNLEGIVLGKPLPLNGACSHYKKSFRWFRFIRCCGRAFPCDICHENSECKLASENQLASRMICGLCSFEMKSSNNPCSRCGNKMGKVPFSSHWEGGKGCRNSSLMSANDKKKHRGKNKTTNKKFLRVGAVGKERRMQKSKEQNHKKEDSS